MSRVRADRQVIEDFALRLRAFDQTLAQEFETISAEWNNVSAFWDDPVQQRFAQMFDEFRPFIRRYLDASDEYEQFLARKLSALKDYEG